MKSLNFGHRTRQHQISTVGDRQVNATTAFSQVHKLDCAILISRGKAGLVVVAWLLSCREL